MTHPPIPEDVRRFILTSVPSVPFLEALLLLRADPARQWDGAMLAGRLYIGERVAADLLQALCTAGMARRCEPQADPTASQPPCCYAPGEALRERIDRLAEVYARQLVDVTHLIHSSLDRKAQQFADAFRLRKDA
ncbi:hypothetical protein [Massilia sp.]|uniref:hypothetical protein n=1 Tax=Massilia sp. TaxID=1882437 RepID=UPI00289EAE1D|nr:hypothetical protein [Massilia sp.]